jgi:hypothetical protein
VIPEAEPDPAVVLVRQPAGVGGRTGHDVAVEPGRKVGDRARAEVDPVEACVTDRVAVPTEHEQCRSPGGPAHESRHLVGEGGQAWPGVCGVHLEQVHGGAVIQVVVTDTAGEREDGAIRRPGRKTNAVGAVC